VLNLYLSGIIDLEEPWTQQDVNDFTQWMDQNCSRTQNNITVYRGTTIPSPIIEYSPESESPHEGTQRLIHRFLSGVVTKSVNYLSTSSDVNIAKEFTGVPLDYNERFSGFEDVEDVEYEGSEEFDKGNTPGYVHVLHLEPGCRIFDMSAQYTRIQLDREKETLLLPKHTFYPIHMDGKYMHWQVVSDV
jgi:hypothetical protein